MSINQGLKKGESREGKSERRRGRGEKEMNTQKVRFVNQV